MRVLDGREQATLSRLLLKLRKGDVVKFVREIRMYDDEDWERVVKDKALVASGGDMESRVVLGFGVLGDAVGVDGGF